MTRGTSWRLLTLGLVIAWTIIIWTAVSLARHPSLPANHCPPTDAANPWCVK
jgi:hypothetical protein